MSSLRNFAIAFLIALFALAGVAYYSLGVVSTLFEPKEASDVSSSEKREVKRFDSDIGGGISDALGSGRSFSVLIVGVDDSGADAQPAPVGTLNVPKRSVAAAIYLARFDKEKRAMELCVIPPSTVVTVDYVEMELGTAYSFKDAQFVRDQVASITGVGIDFYFEFTGREFVKNGPQTPYTAPLSLTFPLYTGDGSYKSYDSGDPLKGEDLYTYLHYNGYKPLQFHDRALLLHGIFKQTMIKLAASASPAEYYALISKFRTDMTYEDVAELYEMLTALPSLIDSSERQTTVVEMDLLYSSCGSFYADGSFVVDRAKAEALYKPYINADT